MRDSYWYGDYLNCRPAEGLRVRIHDYEQVIGRASRLDDDPHKQGPDLTMQVDREHGCPIEAGDMLKIVNELFVKMGARNVVEIELYD